MQTKPACRIEREVGRTEVIHEVTVTLRGANQFCNAEEFYKKAVQVPEVSQIVELAKKYVEIK